MPPDDNESLNIALDILSRHQERLEAVAWKAVTDFELEHAEVAVICGCYNFFWKEFINGLNPYAAKDAARFIKEGLTPVSISVTTLAGFADYLTEFPSDISLPKVAVDTDKVWLLILHEKGHAWLPLSAADSPRLTS
ncbi:hypothetical protein A3I99_02670 [Candidatus Kaiserbacteria bacterium RIFCSPLOWO2_02_FULL_45_11b]|uniref:Uncharacterized protein n=1 Tax=Candidatus Kaiserbacteria bacterium RIFCSPLOWO2_12_FULL_45_26 TaxID=1798525 RepID=A0A1F6FFE0_9BACT|nr:MAG: hypothetical protein A2Z56_01860 [Candidatus Kaiserbacteria bacterium RIFCSPHIGHO2_12_45_16]OGG70286.1 MAG: hypothetical protein A2929_04415 [Candidatus Kaiserbacteria bacterium RIFCSPLOWO2_01_FULL_45_25]OGG81954.1 MAG: hypothetical protein A3I99_02670 [Candidatus Kaiserbacteria bacterium RIFCSPLOWO2_02_FULL_45_11b]OGG84550.1 MAG: hypothetical protein A3G90_00460 [Candidatus Kaiserbacteria bacterium RIFCSPLOWO2_12_FULL_45_26]